MKIFWKIFSFSVIFLSASNLQAASFDCVKASSKMEKAICSNPELSRLDEKLAEAYKNALSKDKSIKGAQVAWIKDTAKCGDDACIRESYTARIKELQGLQQHIATQNEKFNDVNSQKKPTTNAASGSTNTTTVKLEPGTEFFNYPKNDCRGADGKKIICADKNMYKFLCEKARLISINAISTARIFDGELEYQFWKNGKISDLEFGDWAKTRAGDEACFVSYTITGIVQGSTRTEHQTDRVNHFKVDEKGNVVITSVR